MYDRLANLHCKHACSEYLEALRLVEQNCGYSRTNIPQAEDISKYLQVESTHIHIHILGVYFHYVTCYNSFYTYLVFVTDRTLMFCCAGKDRLQASSRGRLVGW